jgi:predicted PurR-regulated permease PerM
MYLLLFYLFVEHDRIAKGINDILPFNPKNSQKLAKEFHTVIKTTMMGNGIVSIIMGVLMGIGLYLLGLGYVAFWTVLAVIIGFIPVLGLQVIWIPLAFIYLILGDTVLAAEIFVFGFILSYLVDPFIRQKVQFRLGKMHGFVTLMGMIVGIMFFGPVGIVVGPMVLTFAYLLAKMINEEYVPNWQKKPKKKS